MVSHCSRMEIVYNGRPLRISSQLQVQWIHVEIGHGGCIYTTKIGKGKIRAPPRLAQNQRLNI